MYKVAPLSSAFMLFAMIGFMLSIVYTSFGKINPSWGFTLGLVFAMMFVAAIISMRYAPIEEQIAVETKERGKKLK